MSDSNQIITTLHKRADKELEAAVGKLSDAAKTLIESQGVWIGTTIEIDGKQYSLWATITHAHKQIVAACQENARKAAVDKFLARVATLGDELDEIRSIAEQGQQQ